MRFDGFRNQVPRLDQQRSQLIENIGPFGRFVLAPSELCLISLREVRVDLGARLQRFDLVRIG